ncbi:putative DNA-damage-inducible protein F [Alloactinosynnema sp. L-07]|uniref:MATE family efflux transporter n=1 Tax=Alloactinosynnema sp. L-07 TaxID=1653480 RepID=UPI00065F06CB|nr:MATE family efflux transporter [Alloactinosynnema sp. L-07]CRK58526.1 putative DNA-damage-inducible protein F [Alloactinosynnema sp. L-07]
MSDLRQVARLALPALPVLAAEPLYLLVDTAVVGHLGATELGALGVGAIVLAQLSTQLTFLSYGTTARAARLHGAGRREDAVGEGVQATWLALVVGLLIVGVGNLLARPVATALAGPGELADAATGWLRIALFGVPMILVTLAGNGWMRGVQDTRRPLRYVLAGNGVSAVLCPVLVYGAGMGLNGSAVANVVGQVVAGALFLRALLAERVDRRPRPKIVRAQLVLGRDLILRSLAFQACFLSAAAVAARTSVGAVGAHQVVLQLWTFLALVLDSLAIAAQALVGAALGSGDDARAKVLAKKITGYGLAFGVALGVVFAALAQVLPRAFTQDSVVLQEIPHAWWFFVAMQPIAGVVFALDGVLLGAGDAKFLRTATLASAIGGFLPLVWLSQVFGWGLVGIWTGLSLFMLIRLATVLGRLRDGRWAVTGTVHMGL